MARGKLKKAWGIDAETVGVALAALAEANTIYKSVEYKQQKKDGKKLRYFNIVARHFEACDICGGVEGLDECVSCGKVYCVECGEGGKCEGC